MARHRLSLVAAGGALVLLVALPAAEGRRIRDHSLVTQPTIPVALVAVSKLDRGVERATADLRVEEVLRGTFPPDTFRAEIVDPDRLHALLAEWKPGDVWLAYFSPSRAAPSLVLDA